MSRAPQTVDDLIASLIEIRDKYGNGYVELYPILQQCLSEAIGCDPHSVPVFLYDEDDKQVYIDFDEEEELYPETLLGTD